MLQLLLSLTATAALLNGSVNDPVRQAGTIELHREAKCRRTKKILFVNMDVYDIFFYVGDDPAWKQNHDLTKQNQLATNLKFLRYVDSARAAGALREGFEINKVDIKAPPVALFLKAFESFGDIDNDEVLELFAVRGPTVDKVTLEGPKGGPVTIEAPPGFIDQVLKIWFGEVSEKNLRTMKSCLLGP